MGSTASPAKHWYRAAMAVVAGGLLASFAWFNYALSERTDAVNAFEQVPPMSGLPMEVGSAGTHTLWAGAACGGYCDVPPTAELLELVTLAFDGPTGRVEPTAYPGGDSYRIDGVRHGRAVWLVEFPEPGTYVVERRNEGAGAFILLMSEGRGMGHEIVPIIAAIVAGAGVIAAALAVVGWYRQRRMTLALLAELSSRT